MDTFIKELFPILVQKTQNSETLTYKYKVFLNACALQSN